MKTTSMENIRLSDTRQYDAIFADLLRLQERIREKLLDGDLSGLMELIETKGDWEKALAKSSESLSPETVLEKAAQMEQYFKTGGEILELLAAKMTLAKTEIQKAAIARKILSNFPQSGIETSNEKSRPPAGSFFDTSG